MRFYGWAIVFAMMLATGLSACGSGRSTPTSHLSAYGVSQTTHDQPSESESESSEWKTEAPTTLDELLELIVADDSQSGGTEKQVASLPDSKNGVETWARSRPGTWQEQGTSLQIYSGSDSIGDSRYVAYAIYKFTGHSGDNVQELDADIGLGPGNEFYVYTVVYSGTPHWQQFGPFDTPPEPPEWPIDLPSGVVSGNGNVYIAIVVYSEDVCTIHGVTIQGSAADGDQYEPDNDKEHATPLSITQTAKTQNHTFHETGDYDYCSFSAQTDRVYHFYTTGSMDTYGRILDSDDNVKDYNDNGGDGNNFKLDWQPDSSGTYYLQIHEYGNNQTGPYTLHYRWTPAGPTYTETENNDSPSQADLLPSFPIGDDDWLGNIGPSGSYDGDVDDWAKFTYTTQPARIQYYAITDGTDVHYNLCDSNGSNWFGPPYFFGHGPGDALTIPLPYPGTYHLTMVLLSGGTDYETRATLLSGWSDLGESNNTVQTSYDVDPDFDQISGYVGYWAATVQDGADEWDFYKFTLPEDKMVWIFLSTQWTDDGKDDIVGRWAGAHIEDDGDWEYPFIGVLYDDPDDPAPPDFPADPSFDVGVYMPLSAGTYYFRFAPSTSSSGKLYYVFRMNTYEWRGSSQSSWPRDGDSTSFYNPTDLEDENPDSETGNNRGVIDTANVNDDWHYDGEFWKYYMNSGTTYYFSMVHYGDNSDSEDLDLVLYTSSGSSVDLSMHTDGREMIKYTPSQSGNYILRVDPWSGTPHNSNGVPYQIVVETYTMENI